MHLRDDPENKLVLRLIHARKTLENNDGKGLISILANLQYAVLVILEYLIRKEQGNESR